MSPLKVLIVEDDPLVALDLEEIVSAMPDARVMVSSSVREAAGLLAEGVDMALLDVDVLDGKTYALADRLRRAAVEFAFVSGSSPAEVPPQLGDVPFVPKPFQPRDIERLFAGRRAA